MGAFSDFQSEQNEINNVEVLALPDPVACGGLLDPPIANDRVTNGG